MVDTKVFLLKTEVAGLRGHKCCITVMISETLTFDCVRFPEARAIKRKIIYHAGPTNSGKTHSALERFHASDSGVYCGPLRLLATEVFRRTNEAVS